MMNLPTNNLIAGSGQDAGITLLLLVLTIIAITCLLVISFTVKRYKRCPPNRALVVYGIVKGGRAAKVIQNGGVFVLPVVQDYAYLSLNAITVESKIQNAVTSDYGQASISATTTVAISSDERIIENAAERLLGLRTEEIAAQANEIVEGQFRREAANLSAEQFHADRGITLDSIEQAINAELNKVGLFVINMNVRELSAVSGTTSTTTSKAL